MSSNPWVGISCYTCSILITCTAGVLFPAVAKAQDAKDAVIERQQKEILQLQAIVADLQRKLAQAQLDQAQAKAVAARFEVEVQVLRERTIKLDAILRQLELQLIQKDSKRPIVREPNPGGGGDLNPPVATVRGVIQKVDGSVVQISLGIDAGVAKGHTLEVYRLKPAPKYLGTIRIIEASNHQSVGRFVAPIGVTNLPMLQVGDQVASKITPTEEPRKK